MQYMHRYAIVQVNKVCGGELQVLNLVDDGWGSAIGHVLIEKPAKVEERMNHPCKSKTILPLRPHYKYFLIEKDQYHIRSIAGHRPLNRQNVGRTRSFCHVNGP
jgi:hypothetical protein